MLKFSIRFLSFTLFLFFALPGHNSLITHNRKQNSKQKAGIFARFAKRYRKYRAYQCTPKEEEQFEKELSIIGNIALATSVGLFFIYNKYIVPHKNFEHKKAAGTNHQIPSPPMINPLPANNPPLLKKEPVPDIEVSIEEEKKDPAVKHPAPEEPITEISVEPESIPEEINGPKEKTEPFDNSVIQNRSTPLEKDGEREVAGNTQEVDNFTDNAKQKLNELKTSGLLKLAKGKQELSALKSNVQNGWLQFKAKYISSNS